LAKAQPNTFHYSQLWLNNTNIIDELIL
jgi:hypothetical protein